MKDSMNINPRLRIWLCGAALLGMSAPQAWGAEVVAVLSSSLGPYQQALAGFAEEYGRPVTSQVLSQGEPAIASDTRLIVAIGGKAAVHSYPSRLPVLYFMAPGTYVSTTDRGAPMIKIYMTPSASVTLHKLKEIQPAMTTLGILTVSNGRDEFNLQMLGVGRSLGVNVIIENLASVDELPDHLRSLKSKINALWVPPDPLLLTPRNFKMMNEFCRSNDIPFYVSTAQLVELGATGHITTSFKDIGRCAGETAKKVLAGKYQGDKVYPERFETILNSAAIKKADSPLSPEAVRHADKVIP